jgi:hypothetical protein
MVYKTLSWGDVSPKMPPDGRDDANTTSKICLKKERKYIDKL